MTAAQLYLEYTGLPCRERLQELIARAKEHDGLEPVTVIVPTPYAAISLRRSLSSGAGLVNVRFMVVPRLAEYLGAPVLATQNRVPLTPLVEAAVIRATAVEMSARPPLENLALNPSLHSSLRHTFSELSLLSESGLKAVSAFGGLRAQVVDWYRLFRSRTSGYYNREDLYRAAVEALNSGKAVGALKDLGYIIFFMIADLSPGERELVKTLGGSNLCCMIAALTREEEIDGITLSLAAELQPEFDICEYAQPGPPPDFSTRHLLVASTAREEVRWIIRHIVQQAEAGVPFHRIAVFYRQQDPYAHLLPAQLGFAGIPLSGPDPSRLKDTPAGKFALHLLEAIEDDFSRSSVMRWMAEAPLKSGDGGPEPPDLIRWDIVSRQAGITSGSDVWLERLEHYRLSLRERITALEADDESSPSRIKGLHYQEKACLHLHNFIEGLIESPPPASGSAWSVYVKWLKSMFSRYLSSPAHWPQGQQESYDLVTGYIDELAQLDELMPGGTDLRGFRSMLDDLLQGPSGKTGTTGTGVFVASLATAQGMEFDHVYIVGMAEGAFPPGLPQDPLLPDAIRQSLPDGDSLPLQRSRRTVERRLYLGVLSAGTSCTLSYPRVNASAQRQQYPSPWFLDELSRLAGRRVASAELEKLDPCQWLSFVYSTHHALSCAGTASPADSHEYDLSSLARFRDAHRGIAGHYLASDDSRLGRFLSQEQARQSTSFTAWDGNVSRFGGVSRRLGLPSDRRFSPTRLERWAICPFRSFLADILGIAVLEQPEETMTISAVDRGALLHRIMERFITENRIRGIMPDYGQPWERDHRNLLLSIAEEEFDRAERSGITGRSLLWEMMKESIGYDLLSLLRDDSRFRAEENTRPHLVEQPFGMDEKGGLPPVELVLENGDSIRLRGLIDRVDTGPDGSRVVVIDYKFGSSYPFKDMNKDPLGAGRHLQLPVYGLAVFEAMGRPFEVTALYWFASTRGKFERKKVSLEGCRDAFLKAVGLIASGISRGLFPANPGDTEENDNCTFCDFNRICPANKAVLWERKSISPELIPYLDLRTMASQEDDRG